MEAVEREIMIHLSKPKILFILSTFFLVCVIAFFLGGWRWGSEVVGVKRGRFIKGVPSKQTPNFCRLLITTAWS